MVGRAAAADGGGRRDEADIPGLNAKAVHHPPQKEGDFRCLRPDIGVGFVQHDPAQLALRLFQDRRVHRAHHHVFQHGQIGDEDLRRSLTDRGPVVDLLRVGSLLVGALSRTRCLWRVSVVERVAHVAAQRFGPGVQPLFLALDQRVERV